MVLALIICLLWKLVNKGYLLRASGWFIEFFVDFSFCNQCLQDQRGRRILKIGTWNCASFHREISHKCFPTFSQNCSSILQQEKWQRHEPKNLKLVLGRQAVKQQYTKMKYLSTYRLCFWNRHDVFQSHSIKLPQHYLWLRLEDSRNKQQLNLQDRVVMLCSKSRP